MASKQLSFLEELGKTSLESTVSAPASESFGLDWERIAKIALPRFPELQPGEHVTRKEIERKLSELKRAGFPVDEDYRKMSQPEMWRYLIHKVRPHVYRMAGKYCPDVVKKIDQRNREAEESNYT